MDTLGIIGGLGPESTIAYYRAILATYRTRHGEATSPSILINSLDVRRVLELLEVNDLDGLTAYLGTEIQRLAAGGSTVALLAANTPHVVFDEVARQSPIPLVSIVAATCREANVRGLKRLGLFGTRFTMQGHFYSDVFAAQGIEIIAPALDEQTFIHDKYTTELLQNVFLARTRAALLRIVGRLVERGGIDGVILGGTELPLLLPEGTDAPVPLLDTTQIHARAAVAQLWP